MKKVFLSILTILFMLGTMALPHSVLASSEKISVYNADGKKVYSISSSSLDSVAEYISSNEQYKISMSSGKFTAGYLALGSNTTITAKSDTYVTATINHIFYNTGLAKGYAAMKNIVISGGVWTASSDSSLVYTMMRFLHTDSITIKNATMYGCYSCHLVELIGCSNVKISNCTFYDKGKTVKESVEECVQLDVVSYSTAPHAYDDSKSKYYDSTPCKNVEIKKCKIRGSRGVCANYAKNEPDMCKKYHYNIKISDCEIEGKTAEAVALFNSSKITVKNNKITTRRKDDTAYSCGLNIQMLNKKATNYAPSKYPVTITGNTIKGGRQAVCMYSHVGDKWGKTTLKSNKLYCRSGKSNAYKIDKNTVKSLTKSNNKLYNWK